MAHGQSRLLNHCDDWRNAAGAPRGPEGRGIPEKGLGEGGLKLLGDLATAHTPGSTPVMKFFIGVCGKSFAPLAGIPAAHQLLSRKGGPHSEHTPETTGSPALSVRSHFYSRNLGAARATGAVTGRPGHEPQTWGWEHLGSPCSLRLLQMLRARGLRVAEKGGTPSPY